MSLKQANHIHDGTVVHFDPVREQVSVQHGRTSAARWRLLCRGAFDDDTMEQLYQRHYRRQKRWDIGCFFLGSTCVAVHSISLLWAADELLGVVLGLCCLLVTLVACAAPNCRRVNPYVDLFITLTGWLLTNVLIMALIPLRVSSCIAFTWLMLINLLTFVTLPIPIVTCIVITATAGVALVSFGTWNLALVSDHIIYQIVSELILVLGSILLGSLAYMVADNRQRRAFLDTRKSLEIRTTVEKQALEQEQLLLSVLPEHVAVKMRQDLGTSYDGQFKKIYMSRHENVSILFADIVGFTAISSTYPASELVHILNELFARFDHLSQKYYQMRIKILGDCYYCICGAPEPRADHAVLCVNMGLAMIEAIKCVRESTLSPVDMRVGIHTGAILAGVLGQRQWQYDVYSQDVELANKMESSGAPGRTLGCLGDQFEVEPAFGERREEALRLASIETYFILRAKHQATQAEEPNPDNLPAIEEKVTPKARKRHYGCFSLSVQPEVSSAVKDDGEEEMYRMIRRATHRFTQTFYDASKESHYRSHRDAIAVRTIYALPLSLTSITLATLVTDQWNLSMIAYPAGIILLLTLCVATHADRMGSCWSKWLTESIASFNSTFMSRTPLLSIAILILCTSHVIVLISSQTTPCCSHAALIMCSVALAPHLFGWFKGLLLLCLTLVYTLIAWVNIHPTAEQAKSEQVDVEAKSHDWTVLVTASTLTAVTLALFALSRHLESKSRILFLWQHQVEEQRERASDLRRRNQALIFNILPPHVASHFLNSRRQIGNDSAVGDQLYSQSFTDVGILFASIPNFAEFYSEETVNNQGLECLRFLNEVISDFDALLDKDQFGEITKIKTIGSTYMAASGLNNSEPCTDESDELNRWRTLSLLVEFALAMQLTLQGINDQSFNHFVLRMGINHGPITAGVIGVSKPHYDIWGNAVNVASRMESTGKAGHIQVTEETSAILRQFGYVFEERGLVSVKGKGQLRTYYLIGKGNS